MNTKHLHLGLVLLFALTSMAHADLIAGYDFGTPASPTASATTVISGVTASNFTGAGGASEFMVQSTLGDNTGQAASGTPFGSVEAGNFSGLSPGLTEVNLTNAISANDYLSFSITADSPGTLNVDGFSIDTAVASNSNDRPADQFNVLAQVNGGTTWLAADALTTDQTVTQIQGLREFQSLFIDLSGDATFEQIDSVEFRIFLWGSNGLNQNISRLNVDQIVVEGTISAIPEPSSFFVALMSAMILAGRRRR